MRTVGIDISTYTGMARVDTGEPGMGKCVNFPDKKGTSRLHSIAQEVGRTLDVWAPDLVVVEGIAYGNKNSLVLMAQCATVIALELHRRGIGWWVVPPSVLKKWTTGNGAASKELMAAFVLKRWGFRSPSDDIVDAFALAQLGQLGAEKLAELKGVSHEH
jgi:Holliday junction resolvasome RuvABC endonuclease subunit